MLTETICPTDLLKASVCPFLSQVALQFPDELLPDAVRVSTEIENETKAKTFILGDTSYGR